MELRQSVVSAVVNNRKLAVLAGAAATVIGLSLGYRYATKARQRVRVGLVSQLLIYPVKSGKPVNVSEAECLPVGLKYGDLQDRHWLVVKEDGHMVTGRQEPRLVLMSLTCEEGRVCLKGPDMEELQFQLMQPETPVMDCRVFGEDIQGRDCGDEASSWLTRYLGGEQKFRLVHCEPHMKLRSPLKEELPNLNFWVAYPDCAPVMLLSEASVKDLSRKVEKELKVERFRPNIVVSDCEAFEEDSWEELQIGSVQLQRAMSCGRCIFTTVDPETGIIDRKEPLETLKSYRQCQPSEKHLYKSSPLFGQLLTVTKTGTMKAGDVVYKLR